MPTGAELIQLILSGGLTGRAMAGMQPPDALAGLGNVTGTPPFLPQGIGPMTPPFVPEMPPPNLGGFAVPGDPGSGAIALPPQGPLDYNAALQRAQAAATGILGPETAPVQEKPSIIGTILQILSQGVSAGLSRDPGAALMEFQRQAAGQRQQQIAQQQQEKERRQGLTAQIFGQEVGAERQQVAEKGREERQSEREMQRFMAEQQRILGAEAFQREEANLQRIFQEKIATERERKEDEKQKALFDQQIKIQKGKLRKDFLDQGAGNYADELADYALGQKDTLSAGAEKANKLIQARIAKLQGLAARGGGGGGGGRAPSMQTFAELSDGNVIPAKDVKLDTLPPGVTVKRLFVPAMQAPAGPATENQILEGIQAARAAGKSEFQIRSALRRDKIPEDKIDLLLRPAFGPYVEQQPGGGILAPPTVPATRMLRGVPVRQ